MWHSFTLHIYTLYLRKNIVNILNKYRYRFVSAIAVCPFHGTRNQVDVPSVESKRLKAE